MKSQFHRMRKLKNDQIFGLPKSIKMTSFLLGMGLLGLGVLANISFRQGGDFFKNKETEEKIILAESFTLENFLTLGASDVPDPLDTGWYSRIKVAGFDVSADATISPQVDLSGSADSAFLQTRRDTFFTDTLYFMRARFELVNFGGSVSSTEGSFFAGIDLDTNGTLDFLLESRYRSQDTLFFHKLAVPAISPSSLALSFSSSDTFSITQAYINTRQNGGDVWAEFGLRLSILDSLVDVNFSGDTIFGDKLLQFVFFSGHQGQVIDIAGVNGGLGSTNSWNTLGVLFQNSLNGFVLGDDDGDGYLSGNDSNNNNPCLPTSGTRDIVPTSLVDCDGDGVFYAQEFSDGTDNFDGCDLSLTSFDVNNTSPAWKLQDCDLDGLLNLAEVSYSTLDSLDFDKDGIPNYRDRDSDADGVIDSLERLNGSGFLDSCSFRYLAPDSTLQVDTNAVSMFWKNADCDGDGVSNIIEIRSLTDPTIRCEFDTTGIGLAGISAAAKGDDCDGDGVDNEDELLGGTDYLDSCDFVFEVSGMMLVKPDTTLVSEGWKNADCDGDGITNIQELRLLSDPTNICDFDTTGIGVAGLSSAVLDLDCDGDGVTNGQEIIDSTDYFEECDFIFESRTLPFSGTWFSEDCDGDNIVNSVEDTFDIDMDGSRNYADIDSDGDGLSDSIEFYVDITDFKDPCDFKFNDQEFASIVALNPESNFWIEFDCDEDGIPNGIEGLGTIDTDADGTPNFLDTDTDGDGMIDSLEW
ncbi:MAG: hypothetical protein RJA52_272, partial [Bacteroidota bacterium]